MLMKKLVYRQFFFGYFSPLRRRAFTAMDVAANAPKFNPTWTIFKFSNFQKFILSPKVAYRESLSTGRATEKCMKFP